PRVGAAVLSGDPVRLAADLTWPLPPLPPNVRPDADAPLTIRITDRLRPAPAGGDGTAPPDADRAGNGAAGGLREPAGGLVYRPPSLVVGVGSARGVAAAGVEELIDRVLEEAGLAPASVRCVATVDRKADEAGIATVARRRGWPVLTFPA